MSRRGNPAPVTNGAYRRPGRGWRAPKRSVRAVASMEVMRHSSTFLLPSSFEATDNLPSSVYALVILNQPLPRFAPLLWERGSPPPPPSDTAYWIFIPFICFYFDLLRSGVLDRGCCLGQQSWGFARMEERTEFLMECRSSFPMMIHGKLGSGLLFFFWLVIVFIVLQFIQKQDGHSRND